MRTLDLGVIRCRPSVQITGRVVGVRGAPVPGASIIARETGKRSTLPFVATADQTGAFVLDHLRAGQYDVTVDASGYGRVVLSFIDAPGRTGLVHLSPLQQLEGTVRHDGAAMDAVEVVLAGSGVWPPIRARSDQNGHFVLRSVPEGIYEIQAFKDDLRSKVLWGVEVRPGRKPLVIELLTGVRIVGVVLDDVTGKRLADVRVTLSKGTLSSVALRDRSDEHGRFEFRAVLPGQYVLSADLAGYLPVLDEKVEVDPRFGMLEAMAAHRWKATSSSGGGGGTSPIGRLGRGAAVGGDGGVGSRQGVGLANHGDGSVGIGADGGLDQGRAVFVLRMERGSGIEGQVVDEVGNPVAGARLEVVFAGRGIWAGTWSDETMGTRDHIFDLVSPPLPASGSLGLSRIPLATTLGVGAASPQSVGGSASPGGSSSGVGVPSIRLDGSVGGSGASGMGTGDAGVSGPAVADHRVSSMDAPENLGVMPGPVSLPPVAGTNGISGQGSDAANYVQSGGFVTDDQGHFRVNGLPAGDVVVLVVHPVFARYRSKTLRLVSSKVRTGLRFVLKRGVALDGRVVDDVGNPLAGVMVVASSQRGLYQGPVAMTDEDGAFHFRNLAGKIRLELTRVGYLSLVARMTLAAGSGPRSVRFALKKANRVFSGVVRDSGDFPVAGAVIEAISVDPTSPGREVGVSDSKGRFSVHHLGRLPYLVRVTATGWPVTEFPRLDLTRDQVLVLHYGGGIEGVVRDGQTKARLVRFAIELKQASGAPLRRTFIDGRFSWVGLRAGRYRVRVSAPAYATREYRIRIPEGRGPDTVTVPSLTWSLQAGCEISGLVRDRQQLPVRNVQVWCDGTGFGGRRSAVRTDRKGLFVLSDLPAGSCVLRGEHRTLGSAQVQVTIRAGEALHDQVLELAGGPRPLEAVRSGVAVHLAEKGDAVVIVRVESGSRAETAGLRRGDELVAINGEGTEGEGLADLAGRLEGPAGSQVVLEIVRAGKRLKVPVRRELLHSK